MLPMNVRDRTALKLIRTFARLEFALKEFPEFVNGQPGEVPDTQWTAFYVLVRGDVDRLTTQSSRDLLLGTHPNDPPPKKMELTLELRVRFVDAALVGPMGDRLMDAARRVRNNLVHGGKEHAHQERYPGHDEAPAKAAIEVMHVAVAAEPRLAPLFYA